MAGAPAPPRRLERSAPVRFWRSPGRLTDPSTTARLFEDLYGVSLDEAWAEAHSHPSPYACDGISDNTVFDWVENDTPSVACPGASDDLRHVFSFDAPAAVAVDSTYYEAPPEILVSMLPPQDGLVAIEWTGTTPLVYAMPDVETFAANWQACDNCALAGCTTYLGREQPLVLKPGVTWISVSLRPQHEPTRVQLFGRRSEP